MLRTSKLALVAAVAATALTAVPAPAGAALGPCRIVDTDTGVVPGWEEVAIAGFYTAPVGAIGVELTCSAVVDGRVYASATDEVPGPVAVVAGAGSVPVNETVTSCYTLRVAYLTRSFTTYTCP